MKKILIITIIVMLSAFYLKADPILIRVADTTVYVYDTLNLPVYADSSFTGEQVTAFQFDFTFTSSNIEILDVITTGSLSEGFGTLSFGLISANRLKIAAAGIYPLSGKGKLFFIKIKAIKQGSSYFQFTTNGDNYFNEGSPVMTKDYGYLTILQRPSISVSPASILLTAGEQVQLSASGGTSPYRFRPLIDSVASIDASGLLTALKRGKTFIEVTDNKGFTDTSTYQAEVRAIELTIDDITVWQANSVKIPVNINSVEGLDILSGTVEVTFNKNYMTYTGFDVSGTLLEGKEITSGMKIPGEYTFTFASVDALLGSGILIYLEFMIANVTSGVSVMDFDEILFNEDIYANSDPGYVTIIALPVLNISPSSISLHAGETQTFSVSNGIAPYTWSTSDPTIASISADGLLTAIRSGTIKVFVSDDVGAKGESQDISVTGIETIIPDTSISIDYQDCGIKLPVNINFFTANESVFSFEMTLSYDTSVFYITNIIKTGSLCENWSVVHNDKGGNLTIAGASASEIKNNGTLFFLQIEFNHNVNIGKYTSIAFEDILYNEGIPFGETYNCQFEVDDYLVKDLGITSLSGPVSQCEPGNVSDIHIVLKNLGSDPYMSCLPVYIAYSINNTEELTDTILLTADLLPGDSIIHTFSSDYDFTDAGDYIVKSYTKIEGDVDMSNDSTTLHVSIYSYSLTVKDMGVTSVTGPVSKCEPGNISSIHVTWQNTASEIYRKCWPIYIAYKVNEGQEQRDTITLTEDILPGALSEHTFSPDYDFTNVGDYEVKAYTEIYGDIKRENDTSTLVVHVYAYPLLDLGPDIITGSFPVILDAGPGMDSYLWNDNSTAQTLSVQKQGTYWAEVTRNGCSDADTIVITKSIGIDNPMNRIIRIYPNPANNKLFIVFSENGQKYSWKILDVLGRVMAYSEKEELINMIDITSIKQGTYILTVSFDNRIEQLIFTIQR